MEYTIRRYKAEDKSDLREICMQTSDAFFHEDEKLLSAVPIVYNDYFTECEPENIFVAADENDRAVGYVICAADTKRFVSEMFRRYVPAAIRTHPKMGFVAFAYMAAVLRHGRHYPAHLHIDILPAYQHVGAGSRLIDALRDHLYANGVDTVYINSMSKEERAYGFYRKYGFTYYGNLGFGFFTLGIPTKRI